MDVVRHDHEGVKVVAPEARISVSNGGNNHSRDFGLAQIDRARLGFVEQSVHGYEDLSRSHCGRWKDSAGREASVEAEGQEYFASDYVPVGETTFVTGHMGFSGWNWEYFLVLARRAEARRQGRSPAPQGGVDAGG